MGTPENFPEKFRPKIDTMPQRTSLNCYICYQLLRSFVGVHLQRDQAVALLKEIITHGLAQPTAVYVRENNGKFELVMKDECRQPLQNFIAEKGLKWRIREDMTICIIFKP